MRARLLVLASAIGSLGWGAVLPYQYAYANETRGWGTLVATGAASLFSVGALVAAPLAGRLADRFNPVAVAVVAQVLGAAAVGSLVLVGTPALFLAGMLVFGLGLAAAMPAKQVLALRWSDSADRRKIFAYKFTAEALGMAAGAFLAGLVVDLGRSDGLDPGFLMAAGGFLASAVVIGWAGRLRTAGSEVESTLVTGDGAARSVMNQRRSGVVRAILAEPALRWTMVVTIALGLGFYAQFESGLPAYAITMLHVDPSVIGTAAAVNCLVVVVLQVVVVRLTAKRSAPLLLMAVGGVWVVSWLLLAVAQLAPGIASVMFITTYAVFAVGETLYSPVLNPLTASLAPAGMVGQMLGTMSALQTAFSAVGPLLAGVLLGSGLGQLFLLLHLAISAVAVVAAWRVHRALVERERRAVGSAVGSGEPGKTEPGPAEPGRLIGA
ncbi:MAG: MFS transporter [Nocardioides sp.]|uniref:MFS transporter n=1 Tax=Nocardioides sp. TaxID=35761 RepID=UPI0039E2546B